MPRRFVRALPGLLLIALIGCAPEETIQTYDVPQAAEYGGRRPLAGDYRILGAMFPAEEPIWFLKFAGRADQVAQFQPEFDNLLKTIRLTPEKEGAQTIEPPTFVAPANWTRTGPRLVARDGITLRIFETLRFGPPETPMEITLTRSGGSTLDNIGRWATQVGLPQPTIEDLSKYTRVVSGDGLAVLRVDLAGPTNPSGGMRAKMPR